MCIYSNNSTENDYVPPRDISHNAKCSKYIIYLHSHNQPWDKKQGTSSLHRIDEENCVCTTPKEIERVRWVR